MAIGLAWPGSISPAAIANSAALEGRTSALRLNSPAGMAMADMLSTGMSLKIFLFILIFTSNYIGIYYISKIIIGLIMILYFTWVIKVVAGKLMDLIENRARENKKKWMAIITQLILSYLLFMIYFGIGYFYAHLPIFFHEIGHLLTAISFKAEIAGIFLSPFEGKTFIDIENLLEIQYTIVAAAGGLGVIFIGTILLLLLHWNNELAYILHFPLSLIIMLAVVSDLYYFCNGAITLSNDIGQIIQINPDLDPRAIAYFSLLGMILVIIFWMWSIKKSARCMVDAIKDPQVKLKAIL